MDPKSNMMVVFVRRTFGCRDTGTGKIPHEDEAEIGVMSLQAKECQGLPPTTRSWKRQERILPQSPHGEHGPADTLTSDF